MRKKFLAVIVCILVTFAATFAWADIRSEIQSQQHRVRQGIHSGELTRRETQILEDDLMAIEKQYRRAARDGRISPHEEEAIYRNLERSSQKINNLTHNTHRTR
jgi:hypothetical protein